MTVPPAPSAYPPPTTPPAPARGRRRRAPVAALTAVLVTLLPVAGCGGGGAGGASPAGAPATTKSYDINPAPRERVRDGGTLRWGITEFPTQWNLNHVDGNLAEVRKVIEALMPAAFRSDDKAAATPNTDYVLDARVIATSPRQVVSYKLNPRARWSDGRPITWQDFEAQWKALNGRNLDYHVASTTGYQDIASVRRGDGDHEVLVTFANPFSEWQALFWPLYPRSTNATPEAFNTGWLNRVPVTAGPFRFGSFDPTAKTITIVRDPHWWGGRAKLDKIIYRSLATDALVGAFTNGELDVFDIGPSAPDYARARNAREAVIRQAAGPDFRHFTFNGESPALADPRVRQAVVLGLDRSAITRSDLQGLDWNTAPLNNHFFMNTQEGYQDNAGGLGKYDPAKAERLLDAAGWHRASPSRVKGGRELSVRFVIPSGLSLSKTEAELTQAMLAKIGVKVAIQSVPSDDFFAKYIIPGNFDIAPFSYIGTPFPISSSYGTYADATRGPGGKVQWNANFGRSGSPEIDTAMRRASSDLNPERAHAYANEADRLIWQKVNVLPLYQRPQNWGVKARLANIGAPGFYTLKYADIGFLR
ncbi:ABC transporter family substrate-binding protein [Sphaerisporangium krabiense]|uniref:Peptide/nickel transport system substrate-binding protein n=1 Tax=Sphaerisporangium krabiense TaxID=763782 RepID=A0A7W8ZA04_9ACTN|nr:ABC transporter family substrate-binding protein [Sphaerisporangium krabiense]MBB5630065.1 peptide/nickel transport system substrate-binding protein [Sphaerisporangium krabiense]